MITEYLQLFDIYIASCLLVLHLIFQKERKKDKKDPHSRFTSKIICGLHIMLRCQIAEINACKLVCALVENTWEYLSLELIFWNVYYTYLCWLQTTWLCVFCPLASGDCIYIASYYILQEVFSRLPL